MVELSNVNKVHILADALRYVRRYHGKTIVIKYGGNAMVDADLQTAFASDVTLLKMVGINPIVVHGGGPQINATLEKIGKSSHFVEGLRYTDHDTMEIVEMVLGGLVNQNIVRLINKQGGRAVGLTGKDGGLLRVQQIKLKSKSGQHTDIGLVGEVTQVDSQILTLLENADFIPVIAPIAASADGQTLNVNADTAAAELAIALSAEALFLLTNTAGVLNRKNQLLPKLTITSAKRLIRQNTVRGGMKPKLECAIKAVAGGVHSCQIIDGTVQHALLLEIFTDEGAGTFVAQ